MPAVIFIVTGSTDSTATDLKDATRAKSVSLESVQIAGGARKYFKNMHVFTKPLVSELFQFVFQDVKLMKELKYVSTIVVNLSIPANMSDEDIALYK